MTKRNKVALISTVAFMLVLVIYAAYAYLNPVMNINNMDIGADISGPLTFTATGGNNLSLKVTESAMAEGNAGSVVASGSDTMTITLETDGLEGICCSYDIIWEWDKTDDQKNQYHKSEGATNEYVFSASLNETYKIGNQTNSISHTNPVVNRQVPDYNSAKLSSSIYKTSICNNTKELTTKAQQVYTLNTNVYNLDVPQDGLRGAKLGSKVKVGNVSCKKSTTLSETVLAKVSNNDYTSSQDQTVYRVKKETAAFVASDATYTKVTNYGTTKIYSGTSATITGGTAATGKFTKAADGTWTSNGTVTNTYYHVVLPIQENGYYEVCYSLGTGNTNNKLQAYVTDNANSTSGTNIYLGGEYNMAATANTPKNGCTYIGYLTTEKALRIVNYAYTSIASVSFYLQKTNEEETMDAGVRYEGNDPDNYVTFNGNEEWRIIGVFEGSTIGLEPGKKYTKIIRNTPMYKAWDEYYYNEETDEEIYEENDWTNSTLNTYLNGEYLQSLTDSDKIAQYNGNYSTWHLLGPTLGQSTIADTNAWYFYERITGTPGYKDGVEGAADATTTGAIGLMYPSDYGYGAYGEGCTSRTSLINYGTIEDWDTMEISGCASVDWLLLLLENEDDYDWLISPNPVTSDGAFYVDGGGGGYVDYDSVSGEWAARPVLYLEASVGIDTGEGTKASPYVLK